MSLNGENYSGETLTDESSIISAKTWNKIVANARYAAENTQFAGATVRFLYSDSARQFAENDDALILGSPIPFEDLLFDTNEIWNSQTPERLYVPHGFDAAEICGTFLYPNDSDWSLQIVKNGTEIISQTYYGTTNKGLARSVQAVVDVVPGDYFTMNISYHGTSGTSRDLDTSIPLGGYGGILVIYAPTQTSGIFGIEFFRRST